MKNKIVKVNKRVRSPTVLSNEQIKELEDIASYFTIEQIAEYFGISRSDFLSL